MQLSGFICLPLLMSLGKYFFAYKILQMTLTKTEFYLRRCLMQTCNIYCEDRMNCSLIKSDPDPHEVRTYLVSLYRPGFDSSLIYSARFIENNLILN